MNHAQLSRYPVATSLSTPCYNIEQEAMNPLRFRDLG
jgi:hypothetical protein